MSDGLATFVNVVMCCQAGILTLIRANNIVDDVQHHFDKSANVVSLLQQCAGGLQSK